MITMPTQLKEQFGVLILVFVLFVLLGVLWIFRADHDAVLSIDQWIAGVIGAILNLVTGKVLHSSNQTNIGAVESPQSK
jgi:drug/metabolite transporter (DMT)-like permease